MRTSNALEGEVRLVTKRVGSAHFPICLGSMMSNGTFNAPVDVSPLYIGIRLQMLPLLLFHKAFHLLQFLFSCVFANHCFKVIIEAPSMSFNFSVSFYKLCLHCLRCVFRVSISGVILCLESFYLF